jgi:hypothetical protein
VAFVLVGVGVMLAAAGLVVVLAPQLADAFRSGFLQGTGLLLELARAGSEVLVGLLVALAGISSTGWARWGRLRVAGVVLGLGLIASALEALLIGLADDALAMGLASACLVGVPGALVLAAAAHAGDGGAGARAGAVALVAAALLFFTTTLGGAGGYTFGSGAYEVTVSRASFSAYEALTEPRLTAVALLVAAAALAVHASGSPASGRVARGLAGGAAIAASAGLVLVGIGAIGAEIWNDEGLDLGTIPATATGLLIAGIFTAAAGGVVGLVAGARALEEAVSR